jgi:protein subunit release factor A
MQQNVLIVSSGVPGSNYAQGRVTDHVGLTCTILGNIMNGDIHC